MSSIEESTIKKNRKEKKLKDEQLKEDSSEHPILTKNKKKKKSLTPSPDQSTLIQDNNLQEVNGKLNRREKVSVLDFIEIFQRDIESFDTDVAKTIINYCHSKLLN